MPNERRSQRSTTPRSRGRSKSQRSWQRRVRPRRPDGAPRRGVAAHLLQPPPHVPAHPLPHQLPQQPPARTHWFHPANSDPSAQAVSPGGPPTHTPSTQSHLPHLLQRDPLRHSHNPRNQGRNIIPHRHQHTHLLPYHHRLRILPHRVAFMLHQPQHLAPLPIDRQCLIASDLRPNHTMPTRTSSIKRNH